MSKGKSNKGGTQVIKPHAGCKPNAFQDERYTPKDVKPDGFRLANVTDDGLRCTVCGTEVSADRAVGEESAPKK